MQPVSESKIDPVQRLDDSLVDHPESQDEFNSFGQCSIKSQCSTEKHGARKTSVCEKDIKIAPAVSKMLSFNLGESWVNVAHKVGFSEAEIKGLQSLYTPKKRWINRVNDLLASSNNKTWHNMRSDPRIIDVIPLFISKAQEKVNIEEFFNAVEKTNYYLAKCARKVQLEEILTKQYVLIKTADRSPGFSSYIFLQWIKMPGRETTWGSIIPNTEILPHQQTVYDWAFLNDDKIVVLWFDSYNLTDEEIRQYYDFESKVKPSANNILVLDVRDVDWSNVSLFYYDDTLSSPPVASMTHQQALEKQEFSSLGDRVDFLREILLYEGSFAIASVLRKTNKCLDLIDCLPSRGVYFDLDFVPRKFDSSEVHHHAICIDDTLRNVSGYNIDCDGTVHFAGHFSNSLIAVNQDHLDILGEYLRVNLNAIYLPYYSGLLTTLNVFRYRVGGTRSFKMRNHLPLYKGDFLPTWQSKYSATWDTKRQDEINAQTNIPLVFRKASPLGWNSCASSDQ